MHPNRTNVIPHLHIRTSGEANDECTNHIFASPFVVLALEKVFEHESKGTNGENIRVNIYEHVNVRTHVKTVHSHRDRGIQMFVKVVRRGTSTNV